MGYETSNTNQCGYSFEGNFKREKKTLFTRYFVGTWIRTRCANFYFTYKFPNAMELAILLIYLPLVTRCLYILKAKISRIHLSIIGKMLCLVGVKMHSAANPECSVLRLHGHKWHTYYVINVIKIVLMKYFWCYLTAVWVGNNMIQI